MSDQNGTHSWWRHQMETFSALLAICAGNSPVPGEFPAKGQWRGALMFSLICVRINGWVNNHEAGDLRRHQAHCDVIVMFSIAFIKKKIVARFRSSNKVPIITSHDINLYVILNVIIMVLLWIFLLSIYFVQSSVNHMWGILCQKQVSISKYTQEYSTGCNYLSIS